MIFVGGKRIIAFVAWLVGAVNFSRADYIKLAARSVCKTYLGFIFNPRSLFASCLRQAKKKREWQIRKKRREERKALVLFPASMNAKTTTTTTATGQKKRETETSHTSIRVLTTRYCISSYL